MAAVSQHGNLRDRTLLIVALHTGLRAEELCGLKPEHVYLGRRSGHVSIYGKRNKYREVPLNSTARDALTTYLKSLPDGAIYLFPSRKRGGSRPSAISRGSPGRTTSPLRRPSTGATAWTPDGICLWC